MCCCSPQWNQLKSHNFATFWVFGKTLLGYVRLSTRPRKNLPRNIKISSKFWLFKRTIFKHPNGCFFVGFFNFPYEVLNVFAKHRFAVLWQSPGRAPYYKTHARYIRTCVEKKAHTSKRVSVIVPDNVISKVQCATHRPEGLPYKREVYFLTKS